MKKKNSTKKSLTKWWPLFITLSIITGLTLITTYTVGFRIYNLFTFGMGYFFTIFALFKLINLNGFANGYAEYDIISRKWFGWGYLYPFIELTIGLLYLYRFNAIWLHILTTVLAFLICLGVVSKLLKRERIQCACMGTVFNLPLTYISLLEYFTMGLMAMLMIYRMI